MADKLVGPKVRITLSKFLPTIFLDAMRENPEVSVHMFEGNNDKQTNKQTKYNFFVEKYYILILNSIIVLLTRKALTRIQNLFGTTSQEKKFVAL